MSLGYIRLYSIVDDWCYLYGLVISKKRRKFGYTEKESRNKNLKSNEKKITVFLSM